MAQGPHSPLVTSPAQSRHWDSLDGTGSLGCKGHFLCLHHSFIPSSSSHLHLSFVLCFPHAYPTFISASPHPHSPLAFLHPTITPSVSPPHLHPTFSHRYPAPSHLHPMFLHLYPIFIPCHPHTISRSLHSPSAHPYLIPSFSHLHPVFVPSSCHLQCPLSSSSPLHPTIFTPSPRAGEAPRPRVEPRRAEEALGALVCDIFVTLEQVLSISGSFSPGEPQDTE